jgi:hypothetical protein
MTRFVGLDVSQKITAICVVDDAGGRLWRGQCRTNPELNITTPEMADVVEVARGLAQDSKQIIHPLFRSGASAR